MLAGVSWWRFDVFRPNEEMDAKSIKKAPLRHSVFQCYTRPKNANHAASHANFLVNHPGDSSLPQVNKKFLIALHITQDSLGNPSLDDAAIAQAKADIISGSSLFSKIGVSFEATDEVNLIENHRFHMIEEEEELDELSKLHSVSNRINLFIIDGFAGGLTGGCGIAGDFSMYMAAGCFNPGSFGHETGHIFGLSHTFNPDDSQTLELVNGSNCDTEGDGICDTPADPYIPNDTTGIVFIEDCAFVYDEKDANGEFYDPDLGNIMSYYFEACACGIFFTDGQLRKMASTYQDSPRNFRWW